MRTLASTFKSREEAQEASRRLERIGISPGRINLKDVADLPEAAARAGVDGGVVLTVKVTTEQVAAASDILKDGKADEAAPPARSGLRRGMDHQAAPISGQAAAPSRSQPPAPPVPDVASEPELPRAETQPNHRSAGSDLFGVDRTQLGRYAALACLAVLLAFLAGAALGLIV